MDIFQQVAIVTGGASGMGAETARFLASLGAQVAILDHDRVKAQQVAHAIGALSVFCDVTQAKSVEKAMTTVSLTLGVPRICIQCAGIAPGGLIVEAQTKEPMPLGFFSHVIEINLIGTFNVLRVVAAHMSAAAPLETQERGIILNTASIAAFEGQIGQSAYAASKGGVVALTLPAARELARHCIRVMTIAPGLIETPLLAGIPSKTKESLSAQIPFPKRLGHPIEYAKLAAHIIENPYLNGEVIRLDGGLRMTER